MSECHSKRVRGVDGLTNQNPQLALPTPSHIPLTWQSGTEVVNSVPIKEVPMWRLKTPHLPLSFSTPFLPLLVKLLEG
jgi:hypothetical protein